MTWFSRLRKLVTRWLDSDDPYGDLQAAGFQRVYYMGQDGQHHVCIDQVGWYVAEEGRCWRFQGSVYDPESWPDLDGAFLFGVGRWGQLPLQFAINPHHACWISDESLVLRPCTVDELLRRLVPHPREWEIAAKTLGLGTITRWAMLGTL